MLPGMDPLNLILLVAAIIVLWRLRSVLGTRTGLERPPLDILKPQVKPENPSPVERLKTRPEGPVIDATPQAPIWEGFAEKGSAIAKSLEEIELKSPGFAVAPFIQGANRAYEMILEAYAKPDKSKLKPLLAKDVYESFAAAIDDRTKNRQTMNFRFVGVKSTKLIGASVKANRAQLTLRFICEMISVTKDSDGKSIDGDDKAIREVSDSWTFERDLSARDPNWKLVATQDNV